MEPVKSFRDLKVYQKAREAAQLIFHDRPTDDFCKYAPSTDYRSVAREEEESPFADH